MSNPDDNTKEDDELEVLHEAAAAALSAVGSVMNRYYAEKRLNGAGRTLGVSNRDSDDKRDS